ncbi:MAG TPA: hypothetical protein VN611_11415 [Patescibacteria group bacterium]|nr:hypothetical protein [Patescibacteria group bacterium]
MSRRAPVILAGDCPYLQKKQQIIVVYRETRNPGQAVPGYQVEEMECDFSDECGQIPCPLLKNAPGHPPGIGLG